MESVCCFCQWEAPLDALKQYGTIDESPFSPGLGRKDKSIWKMSGGTPELNKEISLMLFFFRAERINCENGNSFLCLIKACMNCYTRVIATREEEMLSTQM